MYLSIALSMHRYGSINPSLHECIDIDPSSIVIVPYTYISSIYLSFPIPIYTYAYTQNVLGYRRETP